MTGAGAGAAWTQFGLWTVGTLWTVDSGHIIASHSIGGTALHHRQGERGVRSALGAERSKQQRIAQPTAHNAGRQQAAQEVAVVRGSPGE